MSNEVWKSRDDNIIASYAERLRPVEQMDNPDNSAEDQGAENVAKAANMHGGVRAPRAGKPVEDGIDFKYRNAPPPKDLLNYKNMELEMSLWAKTGGGWMSVIVLLVLAGTCFIMISVLWLLRG